MTSELWRESVEAAESFLRSAAEDVRGWKCLGKAKAALGEPDAALEAYEAARRLAPGDPEVILERSRTCQSMGRTVQARDLLRQCLAAFPFFLPASGALRETSEGAAEEL